MNRPAILTDRYWTRVRFSIAMTLISAIARFRDLVVKSAATAIIKIEHIVGVAAGGYHKPDPQTIGELSLFRKISTSVAGAEVLEVNVWTEGEDKCGEHCWHRLETK